VEKNLSENVLGRATGCKWGKKAVKKIKKESCTTRVFRDGGKTLEKNKGQKKLYK